MMNSRDTVIGTLMISLVYATTTSAFPPYLTEWQTKYPTSTIDERMATLTGANCNTCHHPPTRDLPGNCYREDIKALLFMGRTISQALDELDSEDSDGDGIPNGVEITTPRADQPGQIGYSMGLVGPTGTDPCAVNPAQVVSGQPETPPEMVPTISAWGSLMMLLGLLTAGSVVLVNQRTLARVVQPNTERHFRRR